jgi:chitosanase
MSDVKTKIEQIVNYFESGSKNGDYSCISLYEDGPNQIKQITYGKSQTTEWGNLRDLIKMYINNGGEYATFFTSYVDTIGVNSLVGNRNFISFLKRASEDPIMRSTQDEFFDKHYWQPAKAWYEKNGFKTNLAMLVIYDSFIHSGSILKFLRDKFAEKVPANGGDEQRWILEYCKARYKWLDNHSNPILRKTVYRVDNFLTAIKESNWDLSQTFVANGEEIS